MDTIAFSRLDLADIDGDGRQDLVAAGEFGLAVHYQEPQGGLSAPSRLDLPHHPAHLAFGQLDGEAGTDLLVQASADSTVPALFRGHRQRGLEPLLSSFDPTLLTGSSAPDELRTAGLALPVDCGHWTVELTMAVRDGEVSLNPIGIGQPPAALGRLEGGALPLIVEVRHAGARHLAIALPGQELAWIVSGECSEWGPTLRTRQLPLPAAAVDPGTMGWRPGVPNVIAADVDGDEDEDLIFAVADTSGLARFSAAIALAEDDGFRPAAFEPRFVQAARAIFEQPWPLAAGHLDDDAFTDFVFSGGVYLTRGGLDALRFERWGAPAAAAPILSPFAEALVADLDGDGRADVAVAAEQRPGLELFLSAPGTTSSRLLATRASPSSLRATNLDGRPGLDLVFLERGLLGEHALSVIFGRDFETISLEGTDRISSFEPRDGGLSGNSRLLLSVQLGPRRSWGLGYLESSRERQLLSRNLPLAITSGTNAQTLFGRFLPGDESEELAILMDDQLMLGPAEDARRFTTLDRFRQVPWSSLSDELPPLDPGCALALAGDLDPAGPEHELVVLAQPCVGILATTRVPEREKSRRPTASGSLVVLGWAGPQGQPVALQLPLPERAGRVTKLLARDLDGDGLVDLALAYEPAFSRLLSDPASADPLAVGAESSSSLLVFWGVSADLGSSPPILSHGPITELALEPGAELLDAAALHADADPALELAILSGQQDPVTSRVVASIHIADPHATQATRWSAPVVVAEPSSVLAQPRLVSGDIDLDGLDDLILGDGASISVYRALSSGRMAE